MMNDQQRQLWARIDSFQIDSGAEALTFAGRLARENDWTIEYANRVVDEYKKFIFLMASAGHPVTPSDQVDQAWHLHLTYTRSYWERLCKEVIGRALHHDPTRGGADENHKFDAWYQKTLESYERCLGSPPPPDIWPASAERFAPSNQFQRVNRRRYWLLRRPQISTTVAVVAGLGVLAGIVGCARISNADATASFIVIGLVLVFLLIAIVRKFGSHSRQGCSGGCGASGCGGDGSGGGCGGGGCGGGCGGS